MKRIALALIPAAALVGAADARVYSLQATQNFALTSEVGALNAPKLAIDGDAFIALVDRSGGRSALLYRRGADGRWALSRTLLEVTGGSVITSEVAMDGGIAAVKLDDVLHVYERNAAGEWLESATAGTPRPAPGLSVSGGRILAGRRGCNYDADVFEKSLGSGVWRINGRLSGVAGECNDHGVPLDLSGDNALLRNPGSQVLEYRRNGTAWPQVATLTPPAGVTFGEGALTLWQGTAVARGGATFTRTNGAWSYSGAVRPLDYAEGTGKILAPDLRAGLLVAGDVGGNFRDEASVYVYRQTSPGQFAHAAVLRTPGYAYAHAISGNTVVTGSVSLGLFGDETYVALFDVPAPFEPSAYVNDFTGRGTPGIEQTPGSQFALANVGTNYLYRQSATAGEAHAILPATDWNTQQYISVDITPTAFDGNDRWFGVGIRYVDENNFYYVTIRSSNLLQLKRKVNGVFTTLAQRALPVSLNQRYHVVLTADGPNLDVAVNGSGVLYATDATHTHGRAALMTYRTRADFDNVFAGSTLPFNMAWMDFTDLFDGSRGLERTGGEWTPVEAPGSSNIDGYAQTSTAGDARGIAGVATEDQVVSAVVRLDQSGTSPSGTWFGLLARYVDERTHYYLTVRSTGQLQIRKQINGTISVLASVPYTVSPGEFHEYELSVIADELHAYVDGVFVASALDGEIPRGRFGVGMYRSAATFQSLVATQP